MSRGGDAVYGNHDEVFLGLDTRRATTPSR
jgi:hypothetical protein